MTRGMHRRLDKIEMTKGPSGGPAVVFVLPDNQRGDAGTTLARAREVGRWAVVLIEPSQPAVGDPEDYET